MVQIPVFGVSDTTLESTDTSPEPPFVCGWNDKHQQAVDVFVHSWPVEPGENIIAGLLLATMYPCAAQLEVKKYAIGLLWAISNFDLDGLGCSLILFYLLKIHWFIKVL